MSIKWSKYVPLSNSLSHVRRRSVLEQQRSDGLNRIGPIKWSLALCVMAVFILVYFSLWKGVRSSGKVRWKSRVITFIQPPFIHLNHHHYHHFFILLGSSSLVYALICIYIYIMLFIWFSKLRGTCFSHVGNDLTPVLPKWSIRIRWCMGNFTSKIIPSDFIEKNCDTTNG